MKHKRKILALLIASLGAPLAPSTAPADGVGKICGGFAGLPCDNGSFCEMPAGQCTVKDVQGRCVKVPQICNKIFMPVCGCNGQSYANGCERQAAAVSEDHQGKCVK